MITTNTSGGNQTDETRASANAWRKSADPDGLTRLIFTTSEKTARSSHFLTALTILSSTIRDNLSNNWERPSSRAIGGET